MPTQRSGAGRWPFLGGGILIATAIGAIVFTSHLSIQPVNGRIGATCLNRGPYSPNCPAQVIEKKFEATSEASTQAWLSNDPDR
jgi:hypothetical protein